MPTEELPDRLTAQKKLIQAFDRTSKYIKETSKSFRALSAALHQMALTDPADYRAAVINGALNVHRFEELLSEMTVGVDAGRRAFSQIPKSIIRRVAASYKWGKKVGPGTPIEQTSELVNAYTAFEEEHIRALRTCFEGLTRMAKITGSSSLATDYTTLLSSLRPEQAKGITMSRYRNILPATNTISGAKTVIPMQLSRSPVVGSQGLQFDESVMEAGYHIFNTQKQEDIPCSSGTGRASDLGVYGPGSASDSGHKARVFRLPE